MILLEVKNYIREHRQVPASFLLNHFDISHDTLDGLITPLLSQGYIQKLSPLETSCHTGTCNSGCSSIREETYQWSDKVLKPLPIALEIH